MNVSHSENPNANSQRSVVLRGCCRNRVCFQILFRTCTFCPILGLCAVGPWMVQRYVSNARRWTPGPARRVSGGCVLDVTFPSSRAPTKPAGLIPGGCIVETLGTSEHRPSPRYDFHPSPAYFKMDAQRRLDGIHREAPKHGQTRPRKRFPRVSDGTFTLP